MSDEASPEPSEPATAADVSENDVWARDTAPQTPYSKRQVGIGLLGFLIGGAVAFGVPLLLT